MSNRRTIPVRFWNKVRITSDVCWEWGGSCTKDGYAQFRLGPRIRKAHQVCWEMFWGPIPEGKWVLHTCDNRRCVNPFHLWLGTRQDNIDDMVAKGRNLVPRKRRWKWMNRRNIRAIRSKYLKFKLTRDALAQEYRVSAPTIDRILDNITFTHESYYPYSKRPNHLARPNRRLRTSRPADNGAGVPVIVSGEQGAATSGTAREAVAQSS